MIAIAHQSRPYVLVLLAGALHPSPLRRQLDIPALALPLSAERTLLDQWIDTLLNTSVPGMGVKVVVSSAEDSEMLSALVAERIPHRGNGTPMIEVLIDPSQWRGPAGLLRDIAHQLNLPEETIIVCAEAAVLPPPSLDPLLLCSGDAALAGAIGADEEDHPAGVYAFRSHVIKSIPAIGFHDIKEQLLPSLHQNGKRVPVARLMRRVVRIRDLESYLLAVHEVRTGDNDQISQSANAEISASAYLSGTCLLQEHVRVEDGALVHESVIMEGAQICGGAVIARSVVAPGCIVHPRSVVRSSIVAPMPRPLPRPQPQRIPHRRSIPAAQPVHEGTRP